MDTNTYYIERIKEIVKIAYERDVDMTVALAVYINELSLGAPIADAQAAESAFRAYIKDKRFDEEGNEITE